VVVSSPNWTGFYVGGGFGYGLMNAETTPVATATGTALTSSFTNGGRGWLGIVTAGFDIQATSRIVAGLFGDYDFANIKGTFSSGSATNFFNPLGGEGKMTSAWAVGARAGVLMSPNVLTYVNGG
jgi:outer membrane immunogenic protein